MKTGFKVLNVKRFNTNINKMNGSIPVICDNTFQIHISYYISINELNHVTSMSAFPFLFKPAHLYMYVYVHNATILDNHLLKKERFYTNRQKEEYSIVLIGDLLNERLLCIHRRKSGVCIYEY